MYTEELWFVSGLLFVELGDHFLPLPSYTLAKCIMQWDEIAMCIILYNI